MTYDAWLEEPYQAAWEQETTGGTTLYVERPVPIVGDPEDGWAEFVVEVDVSDGNVDCAVLRGTQTEIVLTPAEVEAACLQVDEELDGCGCCEDYEPTERWS